VYTFLDLSGVAGELAMEMMARRLEKSFTREWRRVNRLYYYFVAQVFSFFLLLLALSMLLPSRRIDGISISSCPDQF